MTTAARAHDCLLLDLDGTVYRGSQPTPGALAVLAAAAEHTRILYVTNNASRSAAAVADHLRDLGFDADAADVVTSAQAAAHLLASQLDAGEAVLVVGTEALAAEIDAVGLRAVRRFDDAPAAVVQGHSTDTAWRDLAEAALALRHGAIWVAANVDPTLPTERGLLPGNGSMVAALRTATDTVPQVAGKPGRTLIDDALARGDFAAALMVGDRLDTDIAGANAAGLPSLLVLCGVSAAAEAVFAEPAQRPTFIAADLRSLDCDLDRLRVAAQPGWSARVDGEELTVSTDGARADDHDDVRVVRAAAAAVWQASAPPRRCVAGDDAAREALRRWDLLGDVD